MRRGYKGKRRQDRSTEEEYQSVPVPQVAEQDGKPQEDPQTAPTASAHGPDDTQDAVPVPQVAEQDGKPQADPQAAPTASAHGPDDTQDAVPVPQVAEQDGKPQEDPQAAPTASAHGPGDTQDGNDVEQDAPTPLAEFIKGTEGEHDTGDTRPESHVVASDPPEGQPKAADPLQGIKGDADPEHARIESHAVAGDPSEGIPQAADPPRGMKGDVDPESARIESHAVADDPSEGIPQAADPPRGTEEKAEPSDARIESQVASNDLSEGKPHADDALQGNEEKAEPSDTRIESQVASNDPSEGKPHADDAPQGEQKTVDPENARIEHDGEKPDVLADESKDDVAKDIRTESHVTPSDPLEETAEAVDAQHGEQKNDDLEHAHVENDGEKPNVSAGERKDDDVRDSNADSHLPANDQSEEKAQTVDVQPGATETVQQLDEGGEPPAEVAKPEEKHVSSSIDNLDPVGQGGTGSAPIHGPTDEEAAPATEGLEGGGETKPHEIPEDKADRAVVANKAMDADKTTHDLAQRLENTTLHGTNPTIPPSRSLLPGPEDIVGDYSIVGPGSVEMVLRLTTSGQFWHAAHRVAKERCRVVKPNASQPTSAAGRTDVVQAYKEFDRTSTQSKSKKEFLENNAEYQTVSVWEIAQALGTWEVHHETDRTSTGKEPKSLLVLHCRNWSWKCSHPTAPATLRPTTEGATELDKMIDAGQVALSYVVQIVAGKISLELQVKNDGPIQPPQPESKRGGPSSAKAAGPSRHSRMRSIQVAMQTLGFVNSYAMQGPRTSKSATLTAAQDEKQKQATVDKTGQSAKGGGHLEAAGVMEFTSDKGATCTRRAGS